MLDYAQTATIRRREPIAVGAFLGRLDWILLGATVALVGLGLWAIAGITRYDLVGDPHYYVVRQGIFAAVGAVGFLVCLAVDPDVYRRHWRVLYGATVGLLLIVLVAAEATRGSRRWIEVGFFRFQPSEFGKLLVILVLAAFLSGRSRRLGEPPTVAGTVGLALLPMLLVFAEPDVGTALVYGAALAACLFVAGVRWVHLGILGALAVVGAVAVLWLLPAADVHILKPYQVARVTGFTDPDHDPGGATYNLLQSKTAVGSGGLTGRGETGATQTKYDYLPEHATDFVFASYAEQRGFVGGIVLLGLYLLVVWRALKIVANARDAFSAVVAGGIAFAFLFQVFVNVGMTIGIAPITGIPLPFMSVGGSSLITNLLAIGVLQAICIRSRPAPRRRL
jgi:rod shape determining protein RodA